MNSRNLLGALLQRQLHGGVHHENKLQTYIQERCTHQFSKLIQDCPEASNWIFIGYAGTMLLGIRCDQVSATPTILCGLWQLGFNQGSKLKLWDSFEFSTDACPGLVHGMLRWSTSQDQTFHVVSLSCMGIGCGSCNKHVVHVIYNCVRAFDETPDSFTTFHLSEWPDRGGNDRAFLEYLLVDENLIALVPNENVILKHCAIQTDNSSVTIFVHVPAGHRRPNKCAYFYRNHIKHFLASSCQWPWIRESRDHDVRVFLTNIDVEYLLIHCVEAYCRIPLRKHPCFEWTHDCQNISNCHGSHINKRTRELNQLYSLNEYEFRVLALSGDTIDIAAVVQLVDTSSSAMIFIGLQLVMCVWTGSFQVLYKVQSTGSPQSSMSKKMASFQNVLVEKGRYSSSDNMKHTWTWDFTESKSLIKLSNTQLPIYIGL